MGSEGNEELIEQKNEVKEEKANINEESED